MNEDYVEEAYIKLMRLLPKEQRYVNLERQIRKILQDLFDDGIGVGTGCG